MLDRGKERTYVSGLGEIAMGEGGKEKRQQSWIERKSGRGERELVGGVGKRTRENSFLLGE